MSILSRVIHDLLTQPPHPLFVHFPIALTGAGLLFILLALWKKQDIFEKAAFANITLAAASTLAAAIVGIRDNLTFYNGSAPNHTTKIILACILLIVTTLTAIARWRNKQILYSRKIKGLYVAAYFVSFAIAAVLGFLGGVIIYGF